MATMTLPHDEMVARMRASDPAADGRFIVGVKTTGIYCMPACQPPRKPKPENCAFFGSPDEACVAGFRACKLCKPDDAYRAVGADAGGSEDVMRSAEMTAYLDTIEEAPGPLTFAVNDAGALLWLTFLDGRYERTIEQELRREGFRIARDRGRTARAVRVAGVLRRRAPHVRHVPRLRGLGLAEHRRARADAHSLRRDAHLRRGGGADRATGGGAGGGAG